jgi:hypothetical protein
MSFIDRALDRLGRGIAGHLEEVSSGYMPFTPSDPETLARTLEPCDVLLVEGNQHISNVIKYLTQSTWSHAALFVGDAIGYSDALTGQPNVLIEANLGEGVVASPLSRYQTYNTRICRPVGLSEEDKRKVIAFARDRIGYKYDTRNILDLARYLLPTPPVPVRWRRRMLALGSGEPTRAICSTLIAEAFQSVRYPVLPRIERIAIKRRSTSEYTRREIVHIRHHSLYAPRDFDISPYFRVVKPGLDEAFDYRSLDWSAAPPGEGALGKGRVVLDRPAKGAAGLVPDRPLGEPAGWDD